MSARRVLAWLDRINAAHPWSHNDAYAGFALVSLILTRGVIRHPHRADGLPARLTAPTVPAADTYRVIREALRAALPGVRVRRGLFWRYTAIWRAPR